MSKEGRRLLATTVVNDQEFVALDDVAAVFQLTVREDTLGAITASYKGKTIVLTPDQPLASVAGRLVSLPAPPARRPGAARRWLVPDEFINRALGLVYDARIELRKPSHLVIVGDVRVPHLQLKYEPSTLSGGRLTIDATPRASSTVSRDGDRLTVKFDADAIDVATTNVPLPQGVLQAVHVTEPSTLTFDLGPRFGTFRASAQTADNSAHLAIDIAASQTQEVQPIQPPSPPPPPSPDNGAPPAAGQVAANLTSIRTVAIDAGHGGEDDGARSADGAKEKDLTLAVARKVKASLESRMGVRVLMTRDEDRAVTIDERTATANNGKADVFISLHANASLRPSAAGASIATAVFDDRAAPTAGALAPERVPVPGGGTREIEFVPWEVAQIPHLRQSAELASIVEGQFRNRIPVAARAIESAPLRVLEAANMPAVLIEMGYLSNADQARLLAADSFQNTLAQALLDAIIRFRDVLDQRK